MKPYSEKKMIRSNAHKRLRDGYLGFQSYIYLNTIHTIHKLDVEVPKAVISRITSDIS